MHENCSFFPFLTREPQIAASDIAAEYEGAETSTSLDTQRLAPLFSRFLQEAKKGENRKQSLEFTQGQ